MCHSEQKFALTDDTMIITEKEFKEFSSDPCSQEVIPESKGIKSFLDVYFKISYVNLFKKKIVCGTDEATRAIENVIVDLNSDECSKQVIEKGADIFLYVSFFMTALFVFESVFCCGLFQTLNQLLCN